MNGDVCFVNIGARGIRRRHAAGLAIWGLAIVFVALLVLLRAPRALRLLAFAPLWIGALSYFQAREKT